ncbi:MAG: NAD(P)-dependent oxidoreductase [Planctomycetaceae bacterium]|nr:NAD(P)-dependent oxidoreductase [Planctomycetaceae bacterium]
MKTDCVGLIGVGLLGSAIAQRLTNAGKQVTVFDLDRSRLTRFDAASSAAEVVEKCDTVILSLPDSNAVAKVIDEIRSALRAESVVIDTTTGDPLRTADIAQGLRYVDATIAGSSAQAATGEVIAMAGGAGDDFAIARPILEHFCKQIFHLGPVGAGARMKLVVNLVIGLNRAVLAEALGLASHCGMNLETTLEVLRSCPAYSAVMDTKGHKMIEGDFTPQARLSQHLKDVKLINQLAVATQADTPLSQLHQSLLSELEQAGFGEEDNSAIFRAFR